MAIYRGINVKVRSNYIGWDGNHGNDELIAVMNQQFITTAITFVYIDKYINLIPSIYGFEIGQNKILEIVPFLKCFAKTYFNQKR